MKSIQKNKTKRSSFGKPDRQKCDKIWLFGFHAVQAAINNKKRVLFRLLATQNSLDKISNTAHLNNLPIKIVKPVEFLKYLDENSVHQGLALETKPLDWGTIKDFDIDQNQVGPILVLDRVKDPQNVGAIIRSTEILGGRAVMGSTHHCAKETGALVKAASGAFERIPYLTVPNISSLIQKLIEMGYLIIGLDHSADTSLINLLKSLKKQRIAFILGSEGSGLRDLTKRRCDHLVQISTESALSVLNVSNAAAITLFASKEFLK